MTYQDTSEKGTPNGYAGLDSSAKLLITELPVIDHGSLSGKSDDDHPQYQLRTEKGMSNGYAPLDTIGVVPLVHLPNELVVDSDLAAHEAAADPHPGYQLRSEKAAANGYASLGADGLVPGEQLPASFFGWNSFASGYVPATQDTLFEVPTGKIASVVYLSVINNSGASKDVELFIHRVAESPVSVGLQTLATTGATYLYVDVGSQWPLSAGDIIEGVATDGTSVAFIMLGYLKDETSASIWDLDGGDASTVY